MKQQNWNFQQIKSSFIASALTGLLFSQVYCFYTQPIQFKRPQIANKFRNRPSLYYLSWGIRMSLAFGIIRATTDATFQNQKQTSIKLCGVVVCAGTIYALLF